MGYGGYLVKFGNYTIPNSLIKIDICSRQEHCVKTGTDNVKTARSMIHPQYADRFIRQYILDKEIWSQQ